MATQELVTIEGSIRETSKKANRELRAQKRVPSVLYGPEIKENINFSVDELELERILRKQQTKLQTLVVDGTEYPTLLKRVEYDPVTDRPVHADFYVLSDDHKVTLRIPIRLQGNAKGVVEAGGRLFQPMKVVQIRVFPKFIPSEFVVDISPLEVGSSFHVGELDLEGITPIDALGRTIVTIRPPKGADFLASLEADASGEGEAEESTEGAETAAEGDTTEAEDTAEESSEE